MTKQANPKKGGETFPARVRQLLDRRGLRFVLAPLLKHRARALGTDLKDLFYDRAWIHETSQGFFAYHKPIVRLDMAEIDKLARLHFLWGYTPGNGHVVMDIGAGVGEEALMFSREVGGGGRVICVEAHPGTYCCLEKLVEYNRLENVITMHWAVTGPSCSVATIEDSDDCLSNRVVGSTGIPVAATTVDAIRRRLGLQRINFLKMNIEGGEHSAMRGMTETLRCTEVLCISCHDFLAESTGDESLRTKGAVKDFLEKHGLKVVERLEHDLPPYVNNQVWAYNERMTNAVTT